MVKIAHASIDEHGNISGGQAGDQTGKEVCIRDWYNKPWNVVIRMKIPAMRLKVADCMKKVVNNNLVGYNQLKRNSLLNYARNVGYDPAKVTTPCETDCSASATLACIYAGISESALVKNGNSATTSTLRGLLKATGSVDIFSDKEYTAKTDNLLVGDILLSEGHHVAVVVETDAIVRKSGMKTSKNGIELIKKFEGCQLKVYLDPVGVPTVGYGHTAGITASMVGLPISQSQADAYLAEDLIKYENAVNVTGLKLSQNQFDALVSFTYNCGAGNLKKLVMGRDYQQIADAMLTYNKAKGQVLNGLTKRRQAERELFMSGCDVKKTGCPYPEPTKTIRLNSRGNDVRWLQWMLNDKGHYGLIINGIAGPLTIGALEDFQKHAFPNEPKEWDGVCGVKTREKLAG